MNLSSLSVSSTLGDVFIHMYFISWAKSNSRCSCGFLAAMLWTNSIKLRKTLRQITQNRCTADLRIGDVIYRYLSYNITSFWLIWFFCCVTVKTAHATKKKTSFSQSRNKKMKSKPSNRRFNFFVAWLWKRCFFCCVSCFHFHARNKKSNLFINLECCRRHIYKSPHQFLGLCDTSFLKGFTQLWRVLHGAGMLVHNMAARNRHEHLEFI